ncbi:MAG: two-component system response regulator NarL [Candidatus Thiodiazotropha sp. (ex Lucina aurantia)]|uniref:DNA-binding response regulator n=2 Tax=Candidatus Thiodiazotropha TaxID=1913444 RepID=A0A7Z1AEV7_9GAMM|nr:two-component system response regulator NarL [Candidatus Thiodiazotropha endolucinida]MBT3010398.1 two-component system response regulator NarL [Candidatus Thiodiazotropha sp. (ex Lucina pensylvanica)]MBT3014225.1 two-component system response regulator NarL [Candidatus Thiodiazotropha taylori]MBT3037925.1 two-component system response regulator NarL [Candidatus Thiodiazotropha sp. (ex Codakia orbicularis)]MBV2102476.1 two-component system response regulator NarL [Candidatus Thiodiazotropha 
MAEQQTYTVLTIDDHPLFRKGVSDLIDMDDTLELVGEAANGPDGLVVAKQFNPDLILLDINMKGMNGLETLKAIREQEIDSRVLMLTVSDNEEDVLTALRLGADGYLLKDMEPEDILKSIRKAVEGSLVISDHLTQLLAKALREDDKLKVKDPITSLTAREKEILQCIAQGQSNKQIANVLNISEGTVKVHVKHLLKKLNRHSRTEAAVWALKEGITAGR